MEELSVYSPEQSLRDDLDAQLHRICEMCITSAELSHRAFGKMQVPTHLEPFFRGNQFRQALDLFDVTLQMAEKAGEVEIVRRYEKYRTWFRRMYRCVTDGDSLCMRLKRLREKTL